MKFPAPGPKKKPPAPYPGVEVGDHLYVKHPRRGPIAVKVLCHGKDGLTGECDQKGMHGIPWDDVLGHKARMLQRYTVVEQGVDGAILADGKGKRRYLAGEVPVAEPAAPAQPEPTKDDPINGGLDRLTVRKAMPFPDDARVVFMKAGPLENRAGLALQDRTDKLGHQTKRWVRTMKDQPKGRDPAKADEPKEPMRHGEVVKFRHGDVEGEGKIIASGADGATVQDADGREHHVKHEALVGSTSADQEGQGGGKPTEEAASPGPDTEKARPAPTDGAKPKGDTPLFDESEVASLPAKAVQPTKDEAELYEKSGVALESLKDWLNRNKGVASQLGYQTMTVSPDDVDFASAKGGMLFIAPLKGKKRAVEKVAQDYNGDWSQLRDVVRCSLAVDTMDDLHGCLDALKKSGLKLAMKPKDRFAKPLPEGYRDLLMNVQFENGMIGEVQLHLKGMLAAKSEGHHHYEVMRDIDAKPRESWSDDDSSKWQTAFDASSAIYGKAWSAVSGGDTGEMRKAMGAGKWQFFERDGAQFRRPAGQPGGATHVLRGKEWANYEGDRTAAYLQGDEIIDPLGGDAGSGDDDGGGDGFAKGGVLFFKAIIPGGASGDLLGDTVQVSGHTKAGRYVAPYAAVRHKRAEETAPITTLAPHTPQPKNDIGDRLAALQARRDPDGIEPAPADALDPVLAAMPAVTPGMKVAYMVGDAKIGVRPLAGVAIEQRADLAVLIDAGGAKRWIPRSEVRVLKQDYEPPKVDGPGPDSKAKHFYVSAIDGQKKHLVAGPYPSHAHAKAQVEAVRKHADRDPRAHFMAWGTAGTEEPIKTPLGADWEPPGAFVKAIRAVFFRNRAVLPTKES